MSRLHSFRSFAAGLALLGASLHAETLASVLAVPPTATQVPTPLAAAATAPQVPLALDTATAAGPARVGDEVTALVALREGTKQRHWLIHLRIAEPTAREVAAHPPKTQTMTATSGRTYSFATGGGVAVDILTLGPVDDTHDSTPKAKRARAFVSPDLLAIGLDQSCRAMLQLAADHKMDGPKAASLSESEERAVLGFFPALMTFFQTVEKSPGLREILWDLVEKPSLWSFIKRRGFDLGLQLGDNSIAVAALPAWTGPALPQYRMSFELKFNGVPSVECSLFVTQPVPPLLTTAGIIGIVAQPPSNPEKQLEIRLVGSRRAAITAKSGAPVSP